MNPTTVSHEMNNMGRKPYSETILYPFTIEILREEWKMDSDFVLMPDEMYLQISSEYPGGKYVGLDEDGKFYKGIPCFMIVGLNESTPYVIKACPETTIIGDLVCELQH